MATTYPAIMRGDTCTLHPFADSPEWLMKRAGQECKVTGRHRGSARWVVRFDDGSEARVTCFELRMIARPEA